MVAFSELSAWIFFEDDACWEPMLSPFPAQHDHEQNLHISIFPNWFYFVRKAVLVGLGRKMGSSRSNISASVPCSQEK